MLALFLASVICVQAGSTFEGPVDLDLVMVTPGTFHSNDVSVANVSGEIPYRASRGYVRVTGVSDGETRLIVSFFSGMSVHRLPVGTIVVGELPAMSASASAAVVAEGVPVTLIATRMGGGDVFWYDSEKYVGFGDSLTIRLPRGRHSITAWTQDRCGEITSNAVTVDVVPPRRRATRH